MKTIVRLLSIFFICRRFDLFSPLRKDKESYAYRFLFFLLTHRKAHHKSYGSRLYEAALQLGPLFIKFGQILSTRRDMISEETAEKLALLQDQVPTLPQKNVEIILDEMYGTQRDHIFSEFCYESASGASLAQVHRAVLCDNTTVAVKIIKPFLKTRIDQDIRVMKLFARLLHYFSARARQLKIIAMVNEFERTLHQELDLMNEAGSCSQFKRLFQDSTQLFIPTIHWPYCTSKIIVMDWVNGIPIKNKALLLENHLDLKQLSETGAEIFFTQVFRDGFFHADMHPGNIFILSDGRYATVDFGIVGTLSEKDKNYLAENFLSFLKRDYRRVAYAHIEAGWAPAHTRVDLFEMAMRSVCEPLLNQPLKDISFGHLLTRFFTIAREFDIVIQPQLLLLQKTMFNIEGLVRDLNPDLDLWSIGKPLLEKWISNQVGLRALWRSLKKESVSWTKTLPELPRLLHQHLSTSHSSSHLLLATETQQKKWIKSLRFSLLLNAANIVVILYLLFVK